LRRSKLHRRVIFTFAIRFGQQSSISRASQNDVAEQVFSRTRETGRKTSAEVFLSPFAFIVWMLRRMTSGNFAQVQT
jgi:hypothetical protein